MTLARAWMLQAESDLRTAVRVDNPADPRTRCQAISKYQQCVEKSVKAVLDKLHTVGLVTQGSDRGHHVSRYAAVLRACPASPDNHALLNQLRRLFTVRIVEVANLLDSLVPAYPRRGTRAPRNHEYPFQDPSGDWHAPTEAESFSDTEIARIRHCAGSLVPRLRRILDALDLLYP